MDYDTSKTLTLVFKYFYVGISLYMGERSIGVKVQILARESFCFDGQTSSAVDHKTYNTFVK